MTAKDKDMQHRFEVGQHWENPDGLIMQITDIRDDTVIYKTPVDIGFQKIARLENWFQCGAIKERGINPA
jgi:hypothetical protein